MEAGHRPVYLPRGTTVLVLDATLDGRNLVYAWNTHTFLLIPPYFVQQNKKSFAWQNFDDRFDSGQFAISLQKTAFIMPSLVPTAATDPLVNLAQAPAEIPSGRVVEVHQIVLFDTKEMREIQHGKFIGYVDASDLRAISRPNLNINSKYYVGSRLAETRVVKYCGVSETISNLKERSSASGVSGGLSFEEIAKLAAEFKQTSRSNETLKHEIAANVQLETFTVEVFTEPVSWNFGRMFGNSIPEGRKIDYNFTKISYCDSKHAQVVISQGNQQTVVPDGPNIIRNEEDFDQYRISLLNEGFSNDDAFFIIALTSTVKQ